MPISPSKFSIKAYGKDYVPGETITGLPNDEEERLISAGFAVRVVIESNTEQQQAPDQPEKDAEVNAADRPDIAALRKVLGGLTKAELVSYSEKAKIAEVNDKMKNGAIVEAVLQDAQEKGVDFDSFTEKQVLAYANYLGIDTADKGREELITIIDSLMGAEDAQL